MATVKRPQAIRIIAMLGILSTLFAFTMLFMPSIKRMGDFIPMILGIIITLQFISFIGIWHMKQWGVQLFIIIFCTRVITFMLLDMMTFRFYYNIFLSLIFIVFFLIHYRKMDTNL